MRLFGAQYEEVQSPFTVQASPGLAAMAGWLRLRVTTRKRRKLILTLPLVLDVSTAAKVPKKHVCFHLPMETSALSRPLVDTLAVISASLALLMELLKTKILFIYQQNNQNCKKTKNIFYSTNQNKKSFIFCNPQC